MCVQMYVLTTLQYMCNVCAIHVCNIYVQCVSNVCEICMQCICAIHVQCALQCGGPVSLHSCCLSCGFLSVPQNTFISLSRAIFPYEELFFYCHCPGFAFVKSNFFGEEQNDLGVGNCASGLKGWCCTIATPWCRVSLILTNVM